MNKQLEDLKETADDLKMEMWAFFEENKKINAISVGTTKKAMNDLLDEIDEIIDEFEE